MGWNYLSIHKLQRCNRWSLGMNTSYHTTLCHGCNYLSMLGLKLNHVSKMGPRFHQTLYLKWPETCKIVLPVPNPTIKGDRNPNTCKNNRIHVSQTVYTMFVPQPNVDGLVRDCSISSALALEMLQSCTKASTCTIINYNYFFSAVDVDYLMYYFFARDCAIALNEALGGHWRHRRCITMTS